MTPSIVPPPPPLFAGGPVPAEVRRRAQAGWSYLSTLPAAQLVALAHQWDFDRLHRACSEFTTYRLLPSGALVHRLTGAVYECDEVRSWPELPGTVVFVGCDCEDQRLRLVPLHRALAAAGAGARCECKHQGIRSLLAGHTLRVPVAPCGPGVAARWVAVTARPAVLK